jgi:hypothetical protein
MASTLMLKTAHTPATIRKSVSIRTIALLRMHQSMSFAIISALLAPVYFGCGAPVTGSVTRQSKQPIIFLP